ncbi:TolC family protein [soil metagenome]
MGSPNFWLLLFGWFMLGALPVRGQDHQVFTIDDFYTQILQHHPVAKQASLFSDAAKQELRIARGLLDPRVNSRVYRKELGGTNYFTLWDNTLRIPVWYGTDLKAGFERNTGFNVNGESFTPAAGLTYLGFSVPLGQGLIIDARRATIRQAQLMGPLAEAEQAGLINKLLLQAGKDYADWMFTFHKRQLLEQGYELALFRFRAVKERVRQGDLSAIDSVEAKIEMQNRQVLVRQAQVEYQNASLVVSNYLWTANNTPVEVTPDLVPSLAGLEEIVPTPEALQKMAQTAQNNHPEILKGQIKLQQLDIERRLLTDNFKPRLNLDYNLIQRVFPLQGESFSQGFLANNYKFGATLGFPVFMRTERGKLQLNKVKIADLNYDLQQAGREINNQILAQYNEMQALEEVLTLQKEIVANTEVMRVSEQKLFENGESSLFLINTREMNLINNQIKLYELIAKQAQTHLTLQWAAGKVERPVAMSE